jgi:hypothetical protein
VLNGVVAAVNPGCRSSTRCAPDGCGAGVFRLQISHFGLSDQSFGTPHASGAWRPAVSVAGLPSARLRRGLLLLPALLARELSPLPVVSPAPLRQ